MQWNHHSYESNHFYLPTPNPALTPPLPNLKLE